MKQDGRLGASKSWRGYRLSERTGRSNDEETARDLKEHHMSIDARVDGWRSWAALDIVSGSGSAPFCFIVIVTVFGFVLDVGICWVTMMISIIAGRKVVRPALCGLQTFCRDVSLHRYAMLHDKGY